MIAALALLLIAGLTALTFYIFRIKRRLAHDNGYQGEILTRSFVRHCQAATKMRPQAVLRH